MQGLIGQKVGMTRVFDKETGEVVPVSIIETGANVIHQMKSTEKDGYTAAQLGFSTVAERKLTKPVLGHVKKWGNVASRVLKEFAVDQADAELKPGARVGVEIFENVKFVDVTGVSKGRGFTGTIKRYNFKRGRKTHGNTNYRERGSTGSNTFPARVFPGLRMAGQHGNAQNTVKRLKVVKLDKEGGLILVRGAIPGKTKGIVFVTKNTRG
jgi:large subunit ribosomal protein L3